MRRERAPVRSSYDMLLDAKGQETACKLCTVEDGKAVLCEGCLEKLRQDAYGRAAGFAKAGETRDGRVLWSKRPIER